MRSHQGMRARARPRDGRGIGELGRGRAFVFITPRSLYVCTRFVPRCARIPLARRVSSRMSHAHRSAFRVLRRPVPSRPFTYTRARVTGGRPCPRSPPGSNEHGAREVACLRPRGGEHKQAGRQDNRGRADGRYGGYPYITPAPPRHERRM